MSNYSSSSSFSSWESDDESNEYRQWFYHRTHRDPDCSYNRNLRPDMIKYNFKRRRSLTPEELDRDNKIHTQKLGRSFDLGAAVIHIFLPTLHHSIATK